MSFLGSIGKVFTRAVTAVATGGISEIVRAVAPSTAKVVDNIFVPDISKAVPLALSAFSGNPAPLISSYTAGGAEPMAFNLGQFLGGVSNTFQNNSNPYLADLGGIAGMASAFVPQAVAQPQPYYGPAAAPQVYPVANSSVPAVRSSSAQALTKDVFDAGAKILLRLGLRVPTTTGQFSSVLKRALGGLASFARRTPTGTIISMLAGLGLTAYEASTLVGWYSVKKKTRRMNPANAKALRRAGRRIKGFHKLCGHLDLIKTHRRAPSFGRKCGTCRKSPCGC